MARKFFKRLLPFTDALLESRIIRIMGPWIRHPNLWHLNKRSAAGGVAIGLIAGLIPGPLQMISAAILCALLRVNLPVALITTFYTNPFTIVPLYLLAYMMGGLVTGESVGDVTVPNFDWNPIHLDDTLSQMANWAMSLGHTLAIGLLMQVVLFSVSGYFVVRIGWRAFVIYEWRRRQERRNSMPSL
jgi:uncharacterized protein